MAKGTAVKVKRLLGEGKLDFLLERSSEEQAVIDASKVARFGEPGQMRMSLVNPSSHWEELRPAFSPIAWNIGFLESQGIPVEEALDLLVEIDDLLWALDAGEASESDLLRCLQLHYVASLYAQRLGLPHPPPYGLVELAALNRARGVIQSSSGLDKLGQDILRYEVWRGDTFLRAFERAYDRGKRLARYRKQVSEEVRPLVERFASAEEGDKDV
jgi:hypothetical protein